MNNVIPHDIFLKLKDAQDKEFENIKHHVSQEIQYISAKFQEELNKNLEKLISNPFNMYLKVLRVCTNTGNIYFEELKKQYKNTFQHELQINEGFFVILVKHDRLICDGDPRPRQLMVENPEPESKEVIFNDAEKKKFDMLDKLEHEQGIKRPEKKDILTASTTHGGLVPLFLQRRNSRLSLPSISARRQKEVSVSDNPEESEIN